MECTVLIKIATNSGSISPWNHSLSRENVCVMLVGRSSQDLDIINGKDNRIEFHEFPKKVTIIVLHKNGE